MGVAEGADVVALAEGAEALVVGHPAGEVRHAGGGGVQAVLDGVGVGAMAEKAGEQCEVAGGLVQEACAAHLVVERAEGVHARFDGGHHRVGDAVTADSRGERLWGGCPVGGDACQRDAGDGQESPTIHVAAPDQISEDLHGAGRSPWGREGCGFPGWQPSGPRHRAYVCLGDAQEVGENPLRVRVRCLSLLPLPDRRPVGGQRYAQLGPAFAHEPG